MSCKDKDCCCRMGLFVTEDFVCVCMFVCHVYASYKRCIYMTECKK